MPFIGNQPALSYTSFAKQDFTTSATTSYTLDNPVANENEIALFINFVRQEPTTAYTASGTSLTLTSATSASDDMYCVFLGKAVQTVNPPNGSVGTAQISSSARTTNLLYPAFEAKLSSAQSISDDTFVKIQFDSEVYDTNNAYDNATNYRFTVPTGFAGKYLVYCTLQLAGDGGDLDILDTGLRIYKNGSSVLWNGFAADNTSTADRFLNIAISTVLDLSESDYLEIYGLVNSVSGTQSIIGDSGVQKRSYFGAYRIGA